MFRSSFRARRGVISSSSGWCSREEWTGGSKLDVADALGRCHWARPADQFHAEQEFRRDQDLLQGEAHAVFETAALGPLPIERQARASSPRSRPAADSLAGEFGENLFRASLFLAAAAGRHAKISRGSAFAGPLHVIGAAHRDCAEAFVIGCFTSAPNNAFKAGRYP